MRRTVIVALLTLAWMIGPVIRVTGEPAPPQPVVDAPRGAHT